MSLVAVLIPSGMLAVAPAINLPANVTGDTENPLSYNISVPPGTSYLSVIADWGEGEPQEYDLSDVSNGVLVITYQYEEADNYTLEVVITTNEGSITRTSAVTILA